MFSFGNKALKTKQKLADITKYADIAASGDPVKDQEKNTAALVEISVEGGKLGAGAYDDTGFLVIIDKSGAFNAEKRNESKNNEEENKIKSVLENSGLPSDPLTIGISKVIKTKIENNSTPGASIEEIDDMLIKILEDIEEEEKLLNSLKDASDDDMGDDKEDIGSLLDLPSYIEQALADDGMLAEQKIIDLKKDLGKASSEKQYLEKEIQAYKDYEEQGYIIANTQTLSDMETRLDVINNEISNLEAELQQHNGSLKEVPDEGNTDSQGTEDIPTDGETQDDLTDEEETDETAESIIILNGSMNIPDAAPQNMLMTIDLETGTVTGIFYLRVDNEGIKLEMDLPISGSIDLETRAIVAEIGEITINGTLSADGNTASGTSSEDGGSWSVSR